VAELDDSPELDPEKANFYQSQIGILRWCVEIGRIDCIAEVSILSSYSAMPREGHLDTVMHIWGYIKHRHNSRMIFDPSYPEIDPATSRRRTGVSSTAMSKNRFRRMRRHREERK
jgi:hypothetical protein